MRESTCLQRWLDRMALSQLGSAALIGSDFEERTVIKCTLSRSERQRTKFGTRRIPASGRVSENSVCFQRR